MESIEKVQSVLEKTTCLKWEGSGSADILLFYLAPASLNHSSCANERFCFLSFVLSKTIAEHSTTKRDRYKMFSYI